MGGDTVDTVSITGAGGVTAVQVNVTEPSRVMVKVPGVKVDVHGPVPTPGTVVHELVANENGPSVTSPLGIAPTATVASGGAPVVATVWAA
jgi:hypothetical protein